MKKLRNSICLVLATSVWSISALAAPQWCTGTIGLTWIDAGGNLMILGSWRNDHTQVCGLNQAWNGIPTTVCSAWFRLLTAAQVLSSQVIFYYPDAPACNALPTYASSLTPGYVMLLNQ